ncbi:MAG: sensor histidine kinase [Actinomycetota bacterium]
MKLAVRSGLASLTAASLTLVIAGALYRSQVNSRALDPVDAALQDRAATAPIIAATAERLSRSELGAVSSSVRVITDDGIVELGQLPEDPLPIPNVPGWDIAQADQQRWRLHTVLVSDVPQVGDRVLVQLVAPLGSVDQRARQLRRQAVLVFLAMSMAAGLAGYGFGLLATRPLRKLRQDAERIDHSDAHTWRLAPAYGADEVDDVAAVLNTSLTALADQTHRRRAALEAAQAFAASASHELRTPLQSAMTHIDIARSELVSPAQRAHTLTAAHEQVRRMASALAAVRALADAESADPSWFVEVDLVEVVEAAVAAETRHDPGNHVRINSAPRLMARVWPDGLQLAVANLVRNAMTHGRTVSGSSPKPDVMVTIQRDRIIIDDAGPGIPATDRERVLRRFERGGTASGSGLGLTIAHQVAVAHGGDLIIGVNPAGGARITLLLFSS